MGTACEYTYTPAFPAARAGFSRNLWAREAVLAWFAGLPAAERRRPAKRGPVATPTRPAASRPARPAPADTTAPARRPYTPRHR